METKKTTMLGAVLAVAIIAFAGVGYAITNEYYAVTTNTGNTMDSVYVELTQDGDSKYVNPYLTGAKFNTMNVYSATATAGYVTTYELVGDLTYTAGNHTFAATAANATSNAVCISDDLTISVNRNGGTATQGTLTVTVDNFTMNNELSYIMQLNDNASLTSECTYNSTAHTGTWSFTVGITDGTEYTVDLYLVASGWIGSSVTGFAPTDAEDSAKNTFTFKLVVTEGSS